MLVGTAIAPALWIAGVATIQRSASSLGEVDRDAVALHDALLDEDAGQPVRLLVPLGERERGARVEVA